MIFKKKKRFICNIENFDVKNINLDICFKK